MTIIDLIQEFAKLNEELIRDPKNVNLRMGCDRLSQHIAEIEDQIVDLSIKIERNYEDIVSRDNLKKLAGKHLILFKSSEIREIVDRLKRVSYRKIQEIFGGSKNDEVAYLTYLLFHARHLPRFKQPGG